ncbi:hypothetical protein VNO78_10573 [Psophocarpus tetragonolobus]|uniref:Uncharacterized protein n=1 Tax=Psophocarpus tetragonolobus TaxID=3891 RepID=A0AAN9SKU5_PSOTE
MKQINLLSCQFFVSQKENILSGMHVMIFYFGHDNIVLHSIREAKDSTNQSISFFHITLLNYAILLFI